ncbi:MAG: OmpA family protein [Prevotella sp.]|nr:OmpA family protein [Candidatus Prevotella equi]
METVQAPESKIVHKVVPGWYIQAQIGGQYTLGETTFGKLVSPNAQLGVGYNFGKVIGARFTVGAWQSKAASNIMGHEYKWKWNYVAPMIDATFNISNLISGVNPKRLVDVSVFVGGGVNIGFNNQEAQAIDAEIVNTWGDPFVAYAPFQDQYLRLLWDGTKVRGVGRIGAIADFKVSKHVSVNAEINANCLIDNYNSKKAGNSDWYFNGLIGAKYTFGKVYKSQKVELPKQIVYKEKIVEKIVEKPVEVKVVDTVKVASRPKLHVEVFFNLAAYKLLGSDAMKVREAANYLKKYPDAKLTIVGLCDKGTGTDEINNPLSEKRANLVKDILVKEYGIPADRIEAIGKGSTIQPYDIPELNRVAICDAE